MNLTKKIKVTTEKIDESRFERVIALVDKFSAIKPNETLLSEDQLLNGIRNRSTMYSGTGYVIVQKLH
jgi:hypothetical protein